MSKQKVTPWFSAMSKQPARVGLYEVVYSGCRPDESTFRFWNGYGWRLNKQGSGTLFGMASGDKWRGLATNPKESSK